MIRFLVDPTMSIQEFKYFEMPQNRPTTEQNRPQTTDE